MSKTVTRSLFRNRAVMSWLLALCHLGMATQALPLVAARPEQLIKWRQSAYQAISWNVTRLKGALTAADYDVAEVRRAATALAGLAASGLPTLFAAGTEKGKGWRETTAAAAVFSDTGKFRQLSDEFARDTERLAVLAAGNDAKVLREQFAKVAQSCKGCHNQFRQTE